MTERMALFFGLDSCISLIWSASKNAWHSSSDGLIRKTRSFRAVVYDRNWCYEALHTGPPSHLSQSKHRASRSKPAHLFSATANTAQMRAAAWEQTSPRPAIRPWHTNQIIGCGTAWWPESVCSVWLAVVKAVSDLFKPSVFFSTDFTCWIGHDQICPIAFSCQTVRRPIVWLVCQGLYRYCITEYCHVLLHCDLGMCWGHRKVLRMLDLKFETQIVNDKLLCMLTLTDKTSDVMPLANGNY